MVVVLVGRLIFVPRLVSGPEGTQGDNSVGDTGGTVEVRPPGTLPNVDDVRLTVATLGEHAPGTSTGRA